MPDEIKHYNVNQRYRVTVERAASSTKQIDGFKVEANGDDLDTTKFDAADLYDYAIKITRTSICVKSEEVKA